MDSHTANDAPLAARGAGGADDDALLASRAVAALLLDVAHRWRAEGARPSAPRGRPRMRDPQGARVSARGAGVPACVVRISARS